MRTLYVPLDRTAARRALTALEAVAERTTTLAPELEELRDTLRAALVEAGESSALARPACPHGIGLAAPESTP